MFRKLIRSRKLNELLISRLTPDPLGQPGRRLHKVNPLTYALGCRVSRRPEIVYMGYLETGYWKFNSLTEFLHTIVKDALRVT